MGGDADRGFKISMTLLFLTISGLFFWVFMENNQTKNIKVPGGAVDIIIKSTVVEKNRDEVLMEISRASYRKQDYEQLFPPNFSYNDFSNLPTIYARFTEDASGGGHGGIVLIKSDTEEFLGWDERFEFVDKGDKVEIKQTRKALVFQNKSEIDSLIMKYKNKKIERITVNGFSIYRDYMGYGVPKTTDKIYEKDELSPEYIENLFDDILSYDYNLVLYRNRISGLWGLGSAEMKEESNYLTIVEFTDGSKFYIHKHKLGSTFTGTISIPEGTFVFV